MLQNSQKISKLLKQQQNLQTWNQKKKKKTEAEAYKLLFAS